MNDSENAGLSNENTNLFNEYNFISNSFEDDLNLNLKQLKFLIDCLQLTPNIEVNSKTSRSSIISSNSAIISTNTTDSSTLNSQFSSLNDLIEYLKNITTGSSIQFIRFLILKRINHFNNSLFNLNKKLIISSQNDSLFELYDKYLNFSKLESNLSNYNQSNPSLKLIITSINIAQLNKINYDLDLNNLISEFKFKIFQFEKQSKNLIIKKKKLSQISSKRSLSADPRSTRHKLAHDDTDSDIENDTDDPSDPFKLNETCLQSDLIKLDLNDLNNKLTPIDLDQKTNMLIIILYKNLPTEEKVLTPIYLESYEITENRELTLIQTISSTVFKKTTKIEIQNSSMFRRMFKSKSKSTSRASSHTRTASRRKADLNTLEPTLCSFLNLNISSNLQFKHFIEPVNQVNINALETWLEIWKPDISNCNINFSDKTVLKFDLVNISLNSVQTQSCLNKRRSKFDQHQISKQNNLNTVTITEDTNSYYFVNIKLCEGPRVMHQLTDNVIFRLNGAINDLYQIKADLTEINTLTVEIELYKVSIETMARSKTVLIGSSSIELGKDSVCAKRKKQSINFVFNEETICLKLKIFILKSQNSCLGLQREIALICNFKPTESNEFDLFNLNENFKLNKTYSEFKLIGKYLEFLSHLTSNTKSKEKNTFRNTLTLKLYDTLIRLISANINSLSSINLDNIQPKHLVQCLINIIKSLFESDSNPDTGTLELTLTHFDFIIKLLIDLSNQSNSLFELKYNLNDLLIIKLPKQLTKRVLVITRLNLSFLNHLEYNDLFNGVEISNLVVRLLGLDTGVKHEGLMDSIVRLVNIDLFSVNYQFRDRLTEVLMRQIEKFIFDEKVIDVVTSLLRFKLKLSKSNLDSLIKISLKLVLNSLSLNSALIQSFLCLIELVDLILVNNGTKSQSNYFYIETLTETDLKQMFDVIEQYFRLNQSIFSDNEHKISVRIDLVIYKFSIYIQKYLIRNLINSQSDPFVYIKSYFNMLFSQIEQRNFTLSQFYLKLKVLGSLTSFWKCLNTKLKRSVYLNEFLIENILETLCVNCYFKQSLTVDFVNTNTELITEFNENLIKFLTEIITINSYETQIFEKFIFLSLLQSIFKNFQSNDFNNLFHIKHKKHDLKANSKLILSMIEKTCDLNILRPIKTCFEYLILKEVDPTCSITERLLFVYKLFKKVDCTSEKCFLFTNHVSLNESKRKLKLYLLDDLYQLNKAEKNYLQMSFIRKQQADLLEWNYSNKNESDLKEILYLKSLKKFAINSLHEKFLLQESVFLSEFHKFHKSIDVGVNDKESLLTSIQFEICKQLCGYYEKLDENCLKFTRILNAESKFAQLASNSDLKGPSPPHHQQHGHLYFRIGLFGKCLKFESIQNKYFLYKHKSYEMLSNIQNLIKIKLSTQPDSDTVALLHHNQDPDQDVKLSQDKCFIQICAVNKVDRLKLIDLVDEMSDQDEDPVMCKSLTEMRSRLSRFDPNSSFYYFDRPFYRHRNSQSSLISSVIDDENTEEFERAKESESVENLWIERSVLILDEISFKYENLSQYEEIKSIFRIMLNPIRNAISDINEKTKEMKHFVVQFTSTNSNNTNLNIIHSLQPLTMRLLGCLDARVNGGLIKYVKELLNVESVVVKIKTKSKLKLLNQLYLSVREQLNVLESGLSIHDRILKDVEVRFRDMTSNGTGNSNSNGNGRADSMENYSEHIKHMNELNGHLIDCLKIIENELNERWSKFC